MLPFDYYLLFVLTFLYLASPAAVGPRSDAAVPRTAAPVLLDGQHYWRRKPRLVPCGWWAVSNSQTNPIVHAAERLMERWPWATMAASSCQTQRLPIGEVTAGYQFCYIGGLVEVQRRIVPQSTAGKMAERDEKQLTRSNRNPAKPTNLCSAVFSGV